MGDATGISWADATFNPWMGCTKVSPGCAHCYALLMTSGRMGLDVWGDSPRQRTAPSNWKKPLRWAALAREGLLPDGKPNPDGHRPRVFCASLADVFEELDYLEPWRRDLFDVIARTPELDWLVLTKRPEFARDWLRSYYEEPIPTSGHPGDGPLFRFEGDEQWSLRDDVLPRWGVLPNVWIGTSIENARHTFRADVLREIPATVRFLSCEPLLGSLLTVPRPREVPATLQTEAELKDGVDDFVVGPREPLDLTGIDWVIVGGESGSRKDARPVHPQWAREIRDAVLAACSRCGGVGAYLAHHPGCLGECAGCPVLEPCDCERPALHFKQWGSYAPSVGLPGDVLLMPDGSTPGRMEADAYGLDLSGGQFMRYAGPKPTSGGKLLDGVDWCEVPPSRSLTPA